ncbi:hypothetical protein G9A89_003308 [Geosiphon pyriformis]|nr:hypothetical protein G9A89_003308 [Geosiphon pyriformis]
MYLEPVSFSAGGSGIILAGLGTQSNSNKKKAHIESMYFRGLLYKKSKNPGMAGGMVNSLAGSVSNNILQASSLECKVFWSSKVESKNASVSGMSNLENMNNIVAKEMSFVNSNNSEADDMVNDTTPRKTRTRTYVLGQLPKRSFFNNMNDIDDILELSSPKFGGSNQKPSIRSCVLAKHSFEPVKLFALDVELSAVSERMNSDKLMTVKKIFYQIDGFGRASTLSKFPEIIKSSFTSKISLNKAKDLVVSEKILVNNNVRQKILVDLSKLAVESVFSKFGKIVSIKIQLIGLWQKALVEFESSEIVDLVAAKWSVFIEKDSVCMAKTIDDKQLNLHHALLYTLSVGITAYDLSGLLESYGGKTCFIGCNSSLYVHNRYVIVCFVDEVSKVAAIGSTPVFKGVNLHWAGLFLAHCARCKQFGHISNAYSVGENSRIREKRVVTDQDWVCLMSIYKRKQAPIVHPVSFGGKTWAQVAGGFSSCVAFLVHHSASLLLVAKTSLFSSAPSDNHDLYGHLVSLECFLELLANQVSGILKKLDSVKLVLLQVTI